MTADRKTQLIESIARLRSTPAPNYPIRGYVPPSQEDLEDFLAVLDVDDSDATLELSRQILQAVGPVQLPDEDYTGDQLRFHYAVSKVRESAQAVLDEAPTPELERLFVKREDYAEDFERIFEGLEAIQSEVEKVRRLVARPALDGFSVNVGPIGIPLSAVLMAAQQASMAMASAAGIDAVALNIALRSLVTNANSALQVGLSIEGVTGAATHGLSAITKRAAATAEIGLRILKAALAAADGAKTAVAEATVPFGGRRRFGWQPEAFGIDIGSSEVRIVGTGGLVAAVPTMGASPSGMTRLAWLDRSRLADRPVVAGILTDPKRAGPILKQAWSQAALRGGFSKHRCVASIPSGLTAVERRALERLISTSLPASPLELVEAPVLAAVGSGFDVSGSDGALIAHVGAGRTQVAVVAYNSVVLSRCVVVGGDDLTLAIKSYMYRNHNLILSLETCENIKRQHCVLRYNDEGPRATVAGFDALVKVPRTVEVSQRELAYAVTEYGTAVIECLKQVLESAPPELAHSIQGRGIILSGGGAVLGGLDREVRDHLGFPVTIVGEPEKAVVRGLQWMLGQKIAQ